MSLMQSLLTSKLVNNIVLGAVRTTMAGIVPTLIASGYLKDDQTNGLIGSVMFLAALGLSALDKLVAAKTVTAALMTPPPAAPVTMQPIANPGA